MAKKLERKVAIEGARIGWTNFSGSATQYRPAGIHTFTIFLDTDIANDLDEQGWNVKWRESKDPEEGQFATLEVTLSYNEAHPEYDPDVYRVCGDRMTALDREGLAILDRDCRQNMIQNVDLGMRSYEWSRPDGSHGVKAYLDYMYVTVEEDHFAKKYAKFRTTADETLPF